MTTDRAGGYWKWSTNLETLQFGTNLSKLIPCPHFCIFVTAATLHIRHPPPAPRTRAALQIRDFPDPGHEFLEGLVLGFPPPFKEKSDLNVETHWENGRVLPRNSFYEFRDKQAAFNRSGPIHGA